MLENKTICRATEAKNINEYFIKDFMEDQKFSKSPNVTNDDTYHLGAVEQLFLTFKI